MLLLFSGGVRLPEASPPACICHPPAIWLLVTLCLDTRTEQDWYRYWTALQSASVAAKVPSAHLTEPFLPLPFLATSVPPEALVPASPFLRKASSSEMTRARSSSGRSLLAGSLGGLLMFGKPSEFLALLSSVLGSAATAAAAGVSGTCGTGVAARSGAGAAAAGSPVAAAAPAPGFAGLAI